METRLVIAGLDEKKTGKLPATVHMAIGMKAMVLLNVATEADIANGTRGEIQDIILDEWEDLLAPDEDSAIYLKYPPAMLLVRGTPYWTFCLPPPDLPPDLPPVMFRHTFRQPHWHLTSLGVPQHLTTPCGTSPASIWPSDLPRSSALTTPYPHWSPALPSCPVPPLHHMRVLHRLPLHRHTFRRSRLVPPHSVTSRCMDVHAPCCMRLLCCSATLLQHPF